MAESGKRSPKVMMAALLSASALVLSLSGNAAAADKSGSFAVHGIGADTCNAVTSAILKGNNGLRGQLVAWSLGYLTATNRLSPDTFDASIIRNPSVLANVVLGVCQHNPKATIEAVDFSILKQMHPVRERTKSPFVDTKWKGHQVRIRKDVLIELQKTLIKQGLLHRADGVYGPDTRDALVTYQKTHHLRPSGLPTEATVLSALLSVPTAKHK